MKIAIFTEGTILMHRNAVGRTREDVIKQVLNKEPSVKEYGNYVQIGSVAEKLKKWATQGARIVYITSRTKNREVSNIQNVLTNNQFPEGAAEYRKQNEEYSGVVRRVMPDVLIEDDCESIGGERAVIQLDRRVNTKMRHIVVREFGGIDHLSGLCSALLK